MSNHLGSPRRFASKRDDAADAVSGAWPEVIEGCGGSAVPGLAGPGHQLPDAGSRPQVDELGQDIGHPCQRIDGIQFARLEQRRVHRPPRGAQVMTGKKAVLSAKTDPADRPLDGVGVDLDAAVVEVAQRAVPMIGMPRAA